MVLLYYFIRSIMQAGRMQRGGGRGGGKGISQMF